MRVRDGVGVESQIAIVAELALLHWTEINRLVIV